MVWCACSSSHRHRRLRQRVQRGQRAHWDPNATARRSDFSSPWLAGAQIRARLAVLPAAAGPGCCTPTPGTPTTSTPPSPRRQAHPRRHRNRADHAALVLLRARLRRPRSLANDGSEHSGGRHRHDWSGRPGDDACTYHYWCRRICSPSSCFASRGAHLHWVTPDADLAARAGRRRRDPRRHRAHARVRNAAGEPIPRLWWTAGPCARHGRRQRAQPGRPYLGYCAAVRPDLPGHAAHAAERGELFYYAGEHGRHRLAAHAAALCVADRAQRRGLTCPGREEGAIRGQPRRHRRPARTMRGVRGRPDAVHARMVLVVQHDVLRAGDGPLRHPRQTTVGWLLAG